MVGFLAFMLVILVGVLILVGGLQWLSEPRKSVEGPRSAPPRVDRLESAIALLEARVDDLQEQQRFLERLLAQRPESRALPDASAGEEATDADSPLLDDRMREGGGEGER